MRDESIVSLLSPTDFVTASLAKEKGLVLCMLLFGWPWLIWQLRLVIPQRIIVHAKPHRTEVRYDEGCCLCLVVDWHSDFKFCRMSCRGQVPRSLN